MSQLRDLLESAREAVSRSLAERLADSSCASLSRTASGSPDGLVDALLSASDADGEAVRRWATALADHESGAEAIWSEVLTGLHCLQYAVWWRLLQTVSATKTLHTLLSEADAAVERLRQAAFTALLPARASPSDNEDFAALADDYPDFVLLATPQGRPTYLNRSARKFLGIDAAAGVPDLSLHHYYADDSWRQIRDEAVPAVKEHGRWEGTSRLQHFVTGELTDVDTTMFLVRRAKGEKASCLAVVHRLRGATRQLEQAFAEVNARKRAILESSLDPIITINHEGVITEYNRAAELAFGHPRDRVLGTKPSDVLFPPTLAADQQTRIDRYLAAGEGSMLGKRAEVMAVRADGETFPAELAMTISLEAGEPVLTFFLRDISLQKQIEAETARHAAELERSNYELQQFAYVASHDLQEPLRKIRTFSDRLEAKCKEQLDETGRECVDRMQTAAARMQSLIDGLLSLSRVTTGGHEFVPVDLQRIAEEVVGDLEAQIERVSGRVELGHLPTIQADPLQMRQLLQNLIGNGMKFHRVDEPPVVKVSGRFVHGRGERPAGFRAKEELCRIVVEDNGIGFEAKHAERIFGVFQRLHPRDVYEGTGIGLALCRRIVERHGGTIAAHSTPGAGSTFEIILPVAQARSKKSVVD